MRFIFTLFLVQICILGSAQTICIDPGHGYGDDGENTDGRTWEEISTNVAVGLLLRDSLESRGYEVILTRENNDTGSWMSLTQRAELADYYESDRLLSIHCNAGGGTGTETFWSRINTNNYKKDSIFSLLVQKHMVEEGDWTNRRSAEDITYLGFQLGVLKGVTTGCLNEIGFVDTENDVEKLLDDSCRQVFAHAYALAIDESFTVEYPSSVVKKEVKIATYPNPFNEYFNVNLPVVDFSGRFELYSSGGIVVKSGIMRGSELSVNTSELSPGIYFLNIISGSNNYHSILIKR